MKNWLRKKIKSRDSSATRLVYRVAMLVRYGTVPAIPGIHNHLDKLHCRIAELTMQLVQTSWNTPQFRARLHAHPTNLKLYNGQPNVTGNIKIEIGESVAMSGTLNIIATQDPATPAELCIGDHVSIAEDVEIEVGRRVLIANHTTISPEVRILAGEQGNAGPITTGLRPLDQSQVFIAENVWLAYSVTIAGNVRIGTGTVVATGSVVTENLPPNVLAAGNPARPIRDLTTGTTLHA